MKQNRSLLGALKINASDFLLDWAEKRCACRCRGKKDDDECDSQPVAVQKELAGTLENNVENVWDFHPLESEHVEFLLEV